ncbi:TetR/AcrR family transcriptional regulator [Umezawaea sp.]|uniref:TetR/AcrR family transcriptional regulator n=1 Tax=Umezawaea sp. TaxID=1955258 RepID=UPI002ECFDB67
MGRWQPGARGRLGQAAMELYVERGYDQTTVAEIAQRAGLTSRTFFRHFADKREVLFAGTDAVQDRLVTALDAVPADTAPLGVVRAALVAVAEAVGDDHDHSRRRQQVISTNAELRERELVKLAAWSRALADGLRRRGADEHAASIAAEVGVAVFRVAFERWATGPGDRHLTDVVRDSFEQLPTA